MEDIFGPVNRINAELSREEKGGGRRELFSFISTGGDSAYPVDEGASSEVGIKRTFLEKVEYSGFPLDKEERTSRSPILFPGGK